MVGLIGGTVTGTDLDAMIEPALVEDWYQVDRFEDGGRGIAHVHHGEKDPGGHVTWTGDRGVVAVHGAIGNRRLLEKSDDELFEAILDRPSVVLPKLDGPFLIAAYDRRDDAFVVATDKVGTRSCYYAESDGLLFASRVGAIQPLLDEQTVNVRTVEDILTFGYAFGDRTMLEEVRSVPPASMVRFRDDEIRVERYWDPEFGNAPVDGYVDRTLGVCRDAMENVTETVAGRPGLWLSGGLDSRTMAAVLKEQLGSFRTLTYDANPGGGVNLEPAKRVANLLGVDNEVTPFEPEPFVEAIPRGIEITDGLVDWGFFVNLPFILDGLHNRVDVMLEAAPQGEYFGEDIWLDNLTDKSPAEGVFSLWGMNDPDLVESLLADPVDPRLSIRELLGESTKSDPQHRTLDTIRRSFAYGRFRSKSLARSQVGTRRP
jgi:asparagine synthase (glutamine-hydrolysing)